MEVESERASAHARQHAQKVGAVGAQYVGSMSVSIPSAESRSMIINTSSNTTGSTRGIRRWAFRERGR